VEDQTLQCKDCAQNFTFTVREQEFFAEKGFTNKPQRCRDCRQQRKASGGGGGGGYDRAERPSFDAVCAACGQATTVPFKPRGDRPVYCRTCYAANAPAPSYR